MYDYSNAKGLDTGALIEHIKLFHTPDNPGNRGNMRPLYRRMEEIHGPNWRQIIGSRGGRKSKRDKLGWFANGKPQSERSRQAGQANLRTGRAAAKRKARRLRTIMKEAARHRRQIEELWTLDDIARKWEMVASIIRTHYSHPYGRDWSGPGIQRYCRDHRLYKEKG